MSSPVRDPRAERRTQAVRAALPPSPAWDAWLDAAGEVAPDLGRLRSRPDVWSPAEGLDGAAGWPARTAAIRARWRRWVIGSMPPAPASVEVEAAASEEGVLLRVRLDAGAAVRARLLLPAGRTAPLPVLLVAVPHLAWAQVAVARGWAACLVSAGDEEDDTDSFDALWAEHDGSRLARRAWALGRVLDGLAGRPEVDATRVFVAGHSRNGKAALIAAAHDERIAGVVSSSSGVLGAIPARLCTDRHFGEGIELLTRHYPDWFHPRLRFFAGREDRLPTDAHELLALIAPRPVLMSVAVNDQVESTAAAERTHAVVDDVYRRLGAPGGLHLAWREGGHGWTAGAVASYLDWCEQMAGPDAAAAAPSAPLHPDRYVRWPITEAPGAGWRPRPPRGAVAPAEPPPCELLPPVGEGRGTVLWCAPLCRATGWRAGYEQATPLPEVLAAQGWRVACWDPVGTGARIREEAQLPAGSSPLARMVADARAVLDRLGPAPVFAVGYATGAITALHLAGIDDRVAGLALVAPTTNEPLLAADPGYGLADLLAAVAPRPTLVLDPRWDPDARAGAVAACARAAGPHVEHRRLADYHRLSGESRAAVAAWLAQTTTSRAPAVSLRKRGVDITSNGPGSPAAEQA